MKPIKQYILVVLFIMLYKVVYLPGNNGCCGQQALLQICAQYRKQTLPRPGTLLLEGRALHF